MDYFKGKRAVITGASSGMGRSLAQQLNSAGCDVWLADINAYGLTAVAAELDEQRAQVHTRVMDVADKDAMFVWAAEIGEQAESVDLVVNNAGVALMAQVKEMSFEDFEWLMGINFWGVVYGSQAFLPLLEKSPRGHLVNIRLDCPDEYGLHTRLCRVGISRHRSRPQQKEELCGTRGFCIPFMW